MQQLVLTKYKENRKAGLPAVHALQHARFDVRTDRQWDRLERLGLVRIRAEPDDNVCIEDLEGDMFNPDVNPEISAQKLEKERRAFIELVERGGVWGHIAEYNIGQGWEHGDSRWGYVDDSLAENNTDVKSGGIQALREAIRARCRCCRGSGHRRDDD